MNSKERVFAVMDGKPVDRLPVAMTWGMIGEGERWRELTGKPDWWIHRLPFLDGAEYVQLMRQVYDRVPLDVVEPGTGYPSAAVRRRQEFVERDGKPFRHDTGTDEWFCLVETEQRADPPRAAKPKPPRRIFTREDVDRHIPFIPASEHLREGEMDLKDAFCRAFGEDRFVLALGPPGALGLCNHLFGQADALVMLKEEPDLVDYIGRRTAQCGIEKVRRLAEAGFHGIYFYDHMSTGDMISPADYARFCLPTMRAMVQEARGLGLKTMVCHYGQVMDRLELIAETGADALQAECAMKGYVNDIGEMAERIGDRMTLCSNIDPYWCIERATEDQLAAEIRRQVEAGRRARGFILGPASPITPGTPLSRIRRFVDLCQEAKIGT